MGAATTLMYSSQGDNSITSMVVDSPFTSLEEIIQDLIHGVKAWIPNAAVKLATSAMRKSIVTKASFDLTLNAPLKYVKKASIPVLFAHAEGDNFIKKKHSEAL